jgi:uncharacterized protein YabE (DUF348 family)/3D (Asp-Asp-Asp) domain-containing protein
MFMTGVLYFTNDVQITADGVTKSYFTQKDDSGEILHEFSYNVGEFDRVVETWGADSHLIEIVRGFGVEIIVDETRFMGSAIPGESVYLTLAENQVILGRHDVIITAENEIEVVRGFGVDVTADGQTITVGTTGATVSELLERVGITLGKDDAVNHQLDFEVARGDDIVVSRVEFRERTDIELITYDTTFEYSNNVAIGDSVVTDGQHGEFTLVYYEKFVDGEVVSSQVISSGVTKEPVTRVVTRGRALGTPVSTREFPEVRLENGRPVDFVAKHTGTATAYTFYEISSWSTGQTASGRKLEVGTVAVDPRIIPYGSLLYIVTTCGSRVYGTAVAADTGGFVHKRNPAIADVFFGFTRDCYLRALQWGTQNVDVYVINTGVY